MDGRQRNIIIGVALAFAATTACSDQSRYRVLSFFFDGVPAPGAEPAEAQPSQEETRQAAGEAVDEAIRAAHRVAYAHQPYQSNRCGGCHNTASGQLFKSVADGLCQMCHAVPGDAPFVHGPVAVNECLFCHHYHAAPYPGLLIEPATTLCLQCHDAADLGPGPHHENAAEQTCIACHDPHGGPDRFFLKGEGP